MAELGRLGIVLANAGISATSTLVEMIEINLSGQWTTIKAAVPHVIAGGRVGSVVIHELVGPPRSPTTTSVRTRPPSSASLV